MRGLNASAIGAALVTLFASAVAGSDHAAAPAKADTVTTVIVVRHTEKMPHAPGGDAGLSPAGARRAQALREMLSDAGVQAIYSSPFPRAKLTGLPLAAQLHDSVRVLDADDVDGLLRRIQTQHAGRTVLVIGHSDTVPKILEALCGRPLPDLGEVGYDRLYVVTRAPGRPATLLKLRYGEPASTAPAR